MSRQLAIDLNRDCHCIRVDRAVLRDTFRELLTASGVPDSELHTPDTLFADSPVFLWEGHIQAMADVVKAIEAVTSHSAYREVVFASLPGQARTDRGPLGALTSYDFHIDDRGPRLIEINTNAGGVLLNHYLASAQQACCPEVAAATSTSMHPTSSESTFVTMFRREWQRQRDAMPLRTLAIVDEDPSSQYLYTEFLLYQSLFSAHGIETVIADPSQLRIDQDKLHVGEVPVDLVYNRLTDFYLSAPESTTLLEAYLNDLVVVTPAPHVYGLLADKRNLPLLSDPERLRALGIPASVIETLAGALPPAVRVTAANADALWTDRKRYFFKPATGFGSRGAYRGAKLTRRVWQDIVSGDYIAQGLVAPPERQLVIDGEPRALKMDFRCVAYDGEVQQISARLYQGQTTNLRTQGGGLATVFATARG